MQSLSLSKVEKQANLSPRCPVFGTCGGCDHQDKSYEVELDLKEKNLRTLCREELDLDEDRFESICASPADYHYRNRIDLTLRRFKNGEHVIGFQHAGTKRIVPIETCVIARKEISDAIPEIFERAKEKLPLNYRNANLVIRTGDSGEVFWGGIGRRSLELDPKRYFWTAIRGMKIFYSLDTFFQANLSILPALIDRIESASGLDRRTVLIDLYAGVGLFGIVLAPEVKRVIAIEESQTSVHLMRYNKAYHQLKAFDIVEAKVEDELPGILKDHKREKKVALIDPPRRGLSQQVCDRLSRAKDLDALLYLSCSPASLTRDLRVLVGAGWQVQKIMPFDFFPQTNHLETLVLLKP